MSEQNGLVSVGGTIGGTEEIGGVPMRKLQIDRAGVDRSGEKAAEAMRAYVLVAVRWAWPGGTRAVGGSLRDRIVAEVEGTHAGVVASTKTYDWSHPALSKLRSLKSEVTAYVKGMTLPWPDQDGMRLLPKDRLDDFERSLHAFGEKLTALKVEVQAVRGEVVERSRTMRGKAFSETDYPSDLASLFGLLWAYHSAAPSDELAKLSSGAYAAEKARQTARMLGAVRMAEEQQAAALHEMAARLAARLEAHGKAMDEGEQALPVTAAMLDGVREFAAHFSDVVCWGCDDLEDIVREAGGAVEGIDAAELKKDAQGRQRLAKIMSEAAERLEKIAPALKMAEKPPATRKVKSGSKVAQGGAGDEASLFALSAAS
jgi:hypothetical protein